MLGKLILLFILVPLADLILLLQLSKYIGWQWTSVSVIVSGILGAWLARQQSMRVLGKIRDQLSRNQVPAGLLTDGAMIMLASGLLLTPGLLTDFAGLTLLIPVCRNWYKARLTAYFKSRIKIIGSPGMPGSNQDPHVVDGEVTGTRTNSDEDSQFDDQGGSDLPWMIEGKVYGQRDELDEASNDQQVR